MTPYRAFLRHTLATVAYRGGKAVRNAPATFAEFKVGPASRTPVEILAHVGDLFDWALWLAKGKHVWKDTEPLPWNKEVERFFESLAKLDAYLSSKSPLGFPAEQIFQGPVADALTHVGQLTMLRRLAGSPIKGENYFKARIQAGRVGSEQDRAVREFE
jgi:hypothetical protein